MKEYTIQIEILYDIKEYNLVIDKNGNYWQLPFVSTDGRQFPIKLIKPKYHLNAYSAVLINQQRISEKKLSQLKVKNPRKEYFKIKKIQDLPGVLLIAN